MSLFVKTSKTFLQWLAIPLLGLMAEGSHAALTVDHFCMIESDGCTTYDHELQISGQATAATTVTLSLANALNPSAILSQQSTLVGADGRWSFAPASLLAGGGDFVLTASGSGSDGSVTRRFDIPNNASGNLAAYFPASRTAQFSLSGIASFSSGSWSLLTQIFPLHSGGDQTLFDNNAWFVFFDTHGYLFLKNRQSGVTTRLFPEQDSAGAADKLTFGNWNSLAIACMENCVAGIYVALNGQYRQLDNSAALKAPGKTLLVGENRNTPTQGYIGLLDELSIWDRGLYPVELTTYGAGKLDGSESGLLGYWTFDEAEYSEAAWRSGSSGSASSVLPAFPSVSGISLDKRVDVSRAVYFDGVDDYVQLPDHLTDSIDGDMSLELWAKPQQVGVGKVLLSAHSAGGVAVNNPAHYFGKQDRAVFDADNWAFDKELTIEFWVRIDSQDLPAGFGFTAAPLKIGSADYSASDPHYREALTVQFSSDSVSYWSKLSVANGTWIPRDQWVHVAITHRLDPVLLTSQVDFYINGELAETVNANTLYSSFANINDAPLHINPVASADEPQQYYLDELRIWNVARSAEQIKANYNKVIGNQDGLVLYLDMASADMNDWPQASQGSVTLTATSVATDSSYQGDRLVAGTTLESVQDGDFLWRVGINNEALPYCTYKDTTVTAVAGFESRQDVWQHLLCSRSLSAESASLSLYIDGKEAAQATLVATDGADPEKQFYLGFDGADTYYQGWIDQLRIWSRAFDQAAVVQTSNTSFDDQTDNLVAQWNFDELTGASAYSSVGGVLSTAVMVNSDSTLAERQTGISSYRTSNGVSSSGSSRTGLWLGAVTISRVNERHQLQNSETVTDTPYSFSMPMLVYVSDTGEASLLSAVTLMQTVGIEDKKQVLVINDNRLSAYEGVVNRNGKLVGQRLSAPGYMLSDHAGVVDISAAMAGSFAAGASLNTTLVYSSSHPMHPYRHRYHNDLGASGQGGEIVRNITLEFDNDSADSSDSEMSATYQETVTGLHRESLISAGTVTFQRVAGSLELIN